MRFLAKSVKWQSKIVPQNDNNGFVKEMEKWCLMPEIILNVYLL
jgi:hypothetical protein